jgi:hypothetical protein
LAGSVGKSGYHYALVFELVPVVIVLLSAHAPEPSFFFILDIIVTDVTIGEEILDFKGIQLLFMFDDLHGQVFFLFGDESGRSTTFKDAYFRDEKLDFPAESIHGEVVEEKWNPKGLFLSFGVLAFMVNNGICFDDLVLVDDDFLTKMASASFIVELVHDLVRSEVALSREHLVHDVS